MSYVLKYSLVSALMFLFVFCAVPFAGAQKVVSVNAYDAVSVALMDDGTVWAWGNGRGDSAWNPVSSSIPQQLNVLNVTAVSSGAGYLLFLKDDGTVWGCGSNLDGALGDGSDNNSLQPVQVINLANVIAISASSDHSLALRDDGTVWAWGDNLYGQLGIGDVGFRNGSFYARSPVQVLGLSNVSAISAGQCYSFALKGDGTVWAWGDDEFGKLGVDTGDSRLVVWDDINNNTRADAIVPIQVSITNVTAISAGEISHTLAIKDDGSVWAWGYGNFGQIGDGGIVNRYLPVEVKGLTNAVAVSAASTFSIALKNDGTVWVWGECPDGGIGLGTANSDITPTPVLVPRLTNVTKISAGWQHTLALRGDGIVWAWGSNRNGQIGNGANAPSPVMILIGAQKAPVPTVSTTQNPATNSSTPNEMIIENSPGINIPYTSLFFATGVLLIIIVGGAVYLFLRKKD